MKVKDAMLALSFLGGAVLMAADPLAVAMAQVNCESFPSGPARTDCYIGLSRINRQKTEISAGVARQQTETAIYHNVTGTRPNNKRRRGDTLR